MPTKTITEGEYTRGFILNIISLYTAMVFALVAGSSTMVVPTPQGLVVFGLATVFMVYFLSIAYAIKHRGTWNWVWSQFVDVPWVMDEIDSDEFVDGPVEVEVPE